MTGFRNSGRIAGLWYLSVIVFGIAAEVLRSTLAPSPANEHFLRVGFVGDVVMMISFVFVGLTFFRLFRGVSENWAGVLAVFVILGVAINMAGLGHYLLALGHLGDSSYATELASYRATYDVANVFFGLWLFPLGVLMAHSSLAPRWLGVVALVASLAFLADGLIKFVFPGIYGMTNPVTSAFMVLGEFTITGWLVVRGSKVAQPAETAS